MLQYMIEAKSKRDQVKFTSAQLARILGMPRSIIQRLIHPDPAKRVQSPKIETLNKIVDFFRSDGFNVSIEHFIDTKRTVEITSMPLQQHAQSSLDIPVYTLSTPLINSIGITSVTLPNPASELFALLAEEDIKPIFKKGSLFIVNPSLAPVNGSLVVAKSISQDSLLIRRYLYRDKQALLQSFDMNENDIHLSTNAYFHLVGVIIHAHAKTH